LIFGNGQSKLWESRGFYLVGRAICSKKYRKRQFCHLKNKKNPKMMIETLKTLFNRDLNRLKSEIEQYQNESDIWKVQKGITNSAGNLCLHLVGNLNTYIGNVFGKTNYVRNRELEFSLKNITKSELIKKIEETIDLVENALDQMSEEEFKKDFPLLVFKNKMTTEFMLIHFTTHLAYHLGQINYHRRLLNE
jgi:uncharacterized damage-inducible protein DinB